MFTPSLASAGPRPVLPPTLQPNAIAAMAPRASRGLSAFLAVGCYALLGGVGYLAALFRHEAPAPPPLVTHGVIDLRGEPIPVRSEPAPLLLPAPAGPTEASASNSEVSAVEPDPVPATPDRFSDVDASLNPGRAVSSHATFQGDPQGSTLRQGSPTGVKGGTGPMEVESASVRILSQVQPNYPQMARIARIQGPVVLRMTIDTQGIPTDVQVASGPHALQAEAVRAARLWRFVPATVDGHPTAATFQLTIVFSLR